MRIEPRGSAYTPTGGYQPGGFDGISKLPGGYVCLLKISLRMHVCSEACVWGPGGCAWPETGAGLGREGRVA